MGYHSFCSAPGACLWASPFLLTAVSFSFPTGSPQAPFPQLSSEPVAGGAWRGKSIHPHPAEPSPRLGRSCEFCTGDLPLFWGKAGSGTCCSPWRLPACPHPLFPHQAAVGEGRELRCRGTAPLVSPLSWGPTGACPHPATGLLLLPQRSSQPPRGSP